MRFSWCCHTGIGSIKGSRTAGIVAAVILVLALAAPIAAQRSPRGGRPGGTPGHPRLDDGLMASTTVARMPSSRSNHAVVAWHDVIYLVGGKSHEKASSAAWTFDPYTRRFEEMPSMQQARVGLGAVICQRRLLVIGGQSDSGAIVDTMEAFDLDRHVWTSAGTMPSARTRFGLACAGGLVWMVGGSDGQRPSVEFHAYDPVRNTWQRKADLPQPRERLALVSLHGDLYAIGGEGPNRQGSNAVWRYTIATDSWSAVAGLKMARRNFSAVRVGDAILVAGGWDHVEDEKIFPPQVEVYEARANKWVAHGHLEAPRDGCRAVAWRGRMLVFGGYSRDIVPYVEEVQWRSQVRDWRVDRAVRPVLLSRANLPPGEGAQELEALPVGPSGHPTLANPEARALGLPTGSDGGKGSWLTQAYRYPTHLSQEASARHAVAPFVAGLTAGAGMIAQMCAGAGIVVDKITAEAAQAEGSPPVSPLRIPTAPITTGTDTVTPQQFLDRSVVSTCVYVGPDLVHRSKPGEGDNAEIPGAGPPQGGLRPGGGSPPPTTDDAEPPQGGVRIPPPGSRGERGARDGKAATTSITALHRSMLELLTRAYRPLAGPDAATAYFLDDSEMDQLGEGPVYTLILAPKQPELFARPQEDRLPVGPMPVFLGASLLFAREDYRMSGPADVADHHGLIGPPILRSTLRLGAAVR